MFKRSLVASALLACGLVTSAQAGGVNNFRDRDDPAVVREWNSLAEGVIPVSFAHDGGYKGSYVSSPVWVRVPEGKNLVFKASLDRFSGSCYTDSDTTPIQPPAGQDSHLTKTYFEQVH